MNIKYYERLKLIAERIKKNNFNIFEILDHQLVKDEKIHTIERVINLFSYLLNDQELPNAFWNFYAETLSFNQRIYTNLSTNDYKNILESLNDSGHEDSLNSFIEFLHVNGLLRISTNRHVENQSSLTLLKHGAQMTIQSDPEFIKNVIKEGKNTLFYFICFYHGIDFLKGRGMDELVSTELNSLSSEEIEVFKKFKMITDPNKEDAEQYEKLTNRDWSEVDFQHISLIKRLDNIHGSLNYDPFEDDNVFGELPVPASIIEFYYDENNNSDSPIENYDFFQIFFDVILEAIRMSKTFVRAKEAFDKRRCFENVKAENAELVSYEDFRLLSNVATEKSLKNEPLNFVKKKNFIGETSMWINHNEAEQWLKDSKRKHRYFDVCREKLDEDFDFESFKKVMDDLIPDAMNIKPVVRHSFNDNDRFIRTDKPIPTRAAPHNKSRWEQIGKRKNGYSYGELNEEGSFYRDCIVKKGFNKLTSSIDSSVNYDLDNGWIEKV